MDGVECFPRYLKQLREGKAHTRMILGYGIISTGLPMTSWSRNNCMMLSKLWNFLSHNFLNVKWACNSICSHQALWGLNITSAVFLTLHLASRKHSRNVTYNYESWRGTWLILGVWRDSAFRHHPRKGLWVKHQWLPSLSPSAVPRTWELFFPEDLWKYDQLVLPPSPLVSINFS